MRKYLNWYSISVAIILVPGSIFLFIIRNENSEGAIFLRPILIALLFGLWFILTIIKVATRPSKPNAIKYVIRSIVFLLIVGILLMFVFQNSLGTILILLFIFALLFLILILLTIIRVISSINNTTKDSNKPHDTATTSQES